MKIKYTKKRLRVGLIFGLIWLVYSLFLLLSKERVTWIDYGFALLTVVYLGTYFYERKYQYLTIKDGVIGLSRPFLKKQITLSEVIQFKKFAGDYILRTKEEELVINTKIIESDSLVALSKVLEQLQVEAQSAEEKSKSFN
ncbi:hypothetical protein [Oceanihabitans sediminis]|uniref:Uncharacterized protein n=1 Tax=Oceanihabitans sediminis TaxID=1812012 RepID=A0A368P3K1_9FLAO|nr:hypothetical protein [Oceanihabitans sediminis]MDX1278141.1 hypothetical protein [Oceanihabitans sediminis]MDX1774072.1 hypothetical protein [Oceanihabitans sediminis]RBP30887.1 hypothetical protein DFR65_104145 [Oceanihabitans sediminis]RCU56850.1 hypothetical protein DU428_10890 [Oceanihabitans sediminis]